MSPSLLDVSVLIALVDADHEQHDRVHEWFGDHASEGWATCAITENGFVRVISQPRYRNPIPTAEATTWLARACESAPGHQFWACDLSLRTAATRLLGASQVTDVYLLTLAAAHDGRFVTLDGSVAVAAALDASPKHLVVL